MPILEIDARTDGALTLAAKIAGLSKQEVVAELVRLHSESSAPPEPPPSTPPHLVPVHMDYEGIRTRGLYNKGTHAVRVVSGPLKGSKYKSPSGAARAVVAAANPSVSPHRNGWNSWTISDTSNLLQSLRFA